MDISKEQQKELEQIAIYQGIFLLFFIKLVCSTLQVELFMRRIFHRNYCE